MGTLIINVGTMREQAYRFPEAVAVLESPSTAQMIFSTPVLGDSGDVTGYVRYVFRGVKRGQSVVFQAGFETRSPANVPPEHAPYFKALGEAFAASLGALHNPARQN